MLSNKAIASWSKTELKEHFDSKELAAKKFIELFRLEEIYTQAHEKDAHDITMKRYIYSEAYLESMFTQFSGIFGSVDEVRQLALGNNIDENELHKKPLAKFNYDIAKDIGLIV